MTAAALIATHLKHLAGSRRAASTQTGRERFLAYADRELAGGLTGAGPDEWAELFGTAAWSQWTVHTYWSHANGFLRWAARRGDLVANPLDQLDRPGGGQSLPDPVTDAEWMTAWERSPDHPWRTLMVLCSYAGLRATEACRLTREDVTQERIRVRKGKGGRDAFLETAAPLWEYVKDKPAGPLVLGVKGGPANPKTVVSNQHLHWRRIGLPGVHLHRFRHWYGTSLLAAGNDVRVIQELMRHKSIQSTQGYTQVVSGQRQRAILTLPTMDLAA